MPRRGSDLLSEYRSRIRQPAHSATVGSGDLSLPIGIHFGVNFAGGLVGTQPLPVSLVRLTAGTTVADSLVLPGEAVAVRLAGAAVAIGLVLGWYRSADGRVRVAPSLGSPTLRWRRDGDATERSRA